MFVTFRGVNTICRARVFSTYFSPRYAALRCPNSGSFSGIFASSWHTPPIPSLISPCPNLNTPLSLKYGIVVELFSIVICSINFQMAVGSFKFIFAWHFRTCLWSASNFAFPNVLSILCHNRFRSRLALFGILLLAILIFDTSLLYPGLVYFGCITLTPHIFFTVLITKFSRYLAATVAFSSSVSTSFM